MHFFRKLFLISLATPLLMSATQLTGSWWGRLDIPAQIPVVFHIFPSSCTMDSPEQGAYGIKADLLYNNNDSVAIAVPDLGVEYKASLHNGQLSGRFRQNGFSLNLSLKPGDYTINRPQTPTPPFPYVTEDISITSLDDGATIAGTLTIADKKKYTPLVVMISGSGQQDRDEQLFGHRPFAVIADHLARNGISSFRYDDRGIGSSTGLNNNITQRTEMNDAFSVVKALRDRNIFDNIGILGHSSGGTIAFMLANAHPEDVDFIISLAGGAVKGDTICVRQQVDANPGLTPLQCRIQLSLAAMSSPWLKYFLEHDPAEDISGTVCPVMAVNGSVDRQVDASLNLDAIRRNLRQKDSDIIKEYPGLNHLFQPSESGNVAEYPRIETTISPRVLDDIVLFISRIQDKRQRQAK